MAYTCSEALGKIRGYYGWSNTYGAWASTNQTQAFVHYQSGGDHEALGHLISAVAQHNVCIGMLTGKYDDFWPDYAVPWYLDNCSGGASMADILTAMMGATFDELTQFMGITQAYKVAVWDAPFNEEFYAALARGFREW